MEGDSGDVQSLPDGISPVKALNTFIMFALLADIADIPSDEIVLVIRDLCKEYPELEIDMTELGLALIRSSAVA